MMKDELSLSGIFHFEVQKSSLSLDQLFLLNSTGVQFMGGSASQLLVLSPLNLNQLQVLFTPLEQVNAYFNEKFILNLSQQFDSNLLLIDKITELSK